MRQPAAAGQLARAKARYPQKTRLALSSSFCFTHWKGSLLRCLLEFSPISLPASGAGARHAGLMRKG